MSSALTMTQNFDSINQEKHTMILAKPGNLEGLHTAFEQGWSIYPNILVVSARQGNVEIFKYLYEQVSANDEYDIFWTFDLREVAKQKGHQAIVDYLDQQKYKY